MSDTGAMMGTYTTWQVPMRQSDGRIVSATFYVSEDKQDYTMVSKAGQPALVHAWREGDDRVLVDIAVAQQQPVTLTLSRVEALTFIALLRGAVYPDHIPDELTQVRAEYARLRRFVHEALMPRYVELFTLSGLGHPEDSVAVQEAQRLLGVPPEGTDHP